MPRIHCRTTQTRCLQTVKMSWCVLPISRPDTHLVHGLTQPSHSTGIALLKHRQRCDPSPVDPQIRKRCGARGVIGHDPGRGIVPTDNSAVSRSYMPAFAKLKPSLADVRPWLDRDEIPVTLSSIVKWLLDPVTSVVGYRRQTRTCWDGKCVTRKR